MNGKNFKVGIGLIAILALALFIFGCAKQEPLGPSSEQSLGAAKRAGVDYVPDEILVKFKPGAAIGAINAQHAASIVDEVRVLNVKVLKVPAPALQRVLAAYQKNPNVEYAELNYIAYAVLTPNDPYFGNQWGMTKVQAPQAWDITQGRGDIKIGILDTGIDQDHEDLVGKIVANKKFATTSRTVDDKYGHGTHVAGIAAAVTNNEIGVAGLGYNSKLMNGKVLNDQGSGSYSWIANGIVWASDPNQGGAKVINMSLGGTSPSLTLESAINRAWNYGAVIVAAAGNSNTDTPFYPAYYSNCIAVAATDQDDAKAYFSNYGSWVDVAAPGVSIYSILPNHKNSIGPKNYGSLSGTSMASPHVAGLAGLVWGDLVYGTSNSSVRNRVESTCDKITGTGTYWVKGRINAYNAVQ